MERRVPSKIIFCELRLVAAFCLNPQEVVAFDLLYFLSLCHGWGKLENCHQQGHEPKATSFLHCFPLRLRMQQAHHFFVALPLCQVVRCFASVERS